VAKDVLILINNFGLDPLLIDDNGDTPLHMACWGGHEELARLLITKYNCPVNHTISIRHHFTMPVHLVTVV
jgi:ankyrin repeat protein